MPTLPDQGTGDCRKLSVHLDPSELEIMASGFSTQMKNWTFKVVRAIIIIRSHLRRAGIILSYSTDGANVHRLIHGSLAGLSHKASHSHLFSHSFRAYIGVPSTRKKHASTHTTTTERASSVAIGRIYAMHAMPITLPRNDSLTVLKPCRATNCQLSNCFKVQNYR